MLTTNQARGSACMALGRSRLPTAAPVTIALMLKINPPQTMRALFVFLLTVSLSACTPALDWREVRGTNAPFTVMLPATPSVQTSQIEQAGKQVKMTMTAASAAEATFAVASSQLPDAASAEPTLEAMKNALLANIDGSVRKQTALPSSYGASTGFDVEAAGKPSPRTGGKPLVLFARFVAKDRRAYQVAVVGPAQAVTADTADLFLDSFKLNRSMNSAARGCCVDLVQFALRDCGKAGESMRVCMESDKSWYGFT